MARVIIGRGEAMALAEVRVWVAENWVSGAGFMAAALLAPVLVLAAELPWALLLIYLHSPVYMIHQVEEHAGDRFRSFANDRMFGGRDALRVIDVLVINLPLVWGLNLAALYAAFLWGPGTGLVAPYAMLVNALVHIAAAVRLRGYNPGLGTAVILFLPLSLAAIVTIGRMASVTPAHHLAGLALAVLLHVLIVVKVLTRFRALQQRPAAG